MTLILLIDVLVNFNTAFLEGRFWVVNRGCRDSTLIGPVHPAAALLPLMTILASLSAPTGASRTSGCVSNRNCNEPNPTFNPNPEPHRRITHQYLTWPRASKSCFWIDLPGAIPVEVLKSTLTHHPHPHPHSRPHPHPHLNSRCHACQGAWHLTLS